MSEVLGMVSGVHIFPIKSCQEATINGQMPAELTVGETGFIHNGFVDRGIVIAGADMLFASQRGLDNIESEHRGYPKDSRLATVAVDIQADHLALQTPGLGALEIGHPVSADQQSEEIRIFGNSFWGFDLGPNVNDYFSRLIEREVRLFWVDQTHTRYISDKKYHKADALNIAAGADGFPFLLTNHASLEDAHIRTGLPLGTLPLTAYRGNIEISSDSAWAEDQILFFRIKNFSGYVVKACSRCSIPNQDQKTGDPHGLSNKILRPIRTGWRKGKDPSVDPPERYFGQNVNHTLSSIGTVIAEGDPVVVEEWGGSNVTLRHSA